MTTADFTHAYAADPHQSADRTVAVARQPLFEPIDFAAMVAAVVMALGPLTAYTVGF